MCVLFSYLPEYIVKTKTIYPKKLRYFVKNVMLTQTLIISFFTFLILD